MAARPFDRRRLEFLPLARRDSKFRIEDIATDPDASPPDPGPARPAIERTAEKVIAARQRGAPVAICFGAHLIKNGLGPLLVRMVEEGWLQLVATNGAGSIHDWEFAFQGRSCEDVRRYVSDGQFGIWDETGRYLGLALLVGGLVGFGYGSSVGRLISEEALSVPTTEELRRQAAEGPYRAAALELLEAASTLSMTTGTHDVPHPWKRFSVQRACFDHGVPCTIHPGIGQDIIYTHPYVVGGAVGRAALDDFLTYADVISRLNHGVYLSVGSSVMSPMVFEKSVSMARNVARRQGQSLDAFHVTVVDLAESGWDWSHGEPPTDDPAYYVRFCKSFSRMGGSLEYIGLDNRVFLTNLYHRLRSSQGA